MLKMCLCVCNRGVMTRPWWTEEEREANRELTLRKKILKVCGQTTNASGIQKGFKQLRAAAAETAYSVLATAACS